MSFNEFGVFIQESFHAQVVSSLAQIHFTGREANKDYWAFKTWLRLINIKDDAPCKNSSYSDFCQTMIIAVAFDRYIYSLCTRHRAALEVYTKTMGEKFRLCVQ